MLSGEGQAEFVTLFSRFSGEGGSFDALVFRDQVTIRTDRWALTLTDGAEKPWASGQASYQPWGAVSESSLTVHNPQGAWVELGELTPWEAARDFERYIPVARARAARPLRDLEETLRRARYAAWVEDEPGAQAAVVAAAKDLAARGGAPEVVWPQLIAEDADVAAQR